MPLRDVRSAAALCVFAALAACSSGTDAPVATSISVTPTQLTLASLNITSAPLVARVLDQRGDSMTGVTVTWSSSDNLVATVNPATGQVTSVSNGTATVTATAGSATRDVPVTVSQLAAGVIKTGDTQSGTVGAALATSLGVHVTDAAGAVIANRAVVFAVTSGGGSLGTANATTNATGDAQTTWTLGTSTSMAHTVTATIGTFVATFSATALAGAAATITIEAGNNQTRAVNTSLATAPSVRVRDGFNNVKPGATVVFTPTAGGGQVSGGTRTTDASGIATVTSWTMGGSAGTNTLQAAVQGTAFTVDFTATAVVAGAPTTITMFGGNNQTALVNYPTNIRPSVLVTDIGGQPVAGVSVTFVAATGGGGVTNGTVNTNAQGIAQVGNWIVGVGAGANTLTATAAPGGITNNPITFNATGAVKQYDIVIQQYGPPFSATVQAAFDSAEAAWESIIYGEMSDVAISTTNACGSGQSIQTTVDDVIILATFEPIDGPSGVLGSAGPCSIRTSNGNTIYGLMRFDIADTTLLSQGGNLKRVILHEMGHVLGFTSGIWNTQGGIAQQHTCALLLSAAGNFQDTHFNCPITLARFDSIGGGSYTGGNKVPLENCVSGVPASCGPGNFNSHWREAIFDTELMTPYFDGGMQNLFSILSITTFEDIGYQVNYGAAEAYSQVFTTPPLLQAASRVVAGSNVLDLSNDALNVPVLVRDVGGRVVRVIPARP